MTTDHQVDGMIEELRAGLREQQTVLSEQQSVLAAQTERIALLEGQRRSPRNARLTTDDIPERRPRRLTRGGMLKAAAMGAIGLAGAEAASSLGAESAFADPSTANDYTASGLSTGGGTGFQTASNAGFEIGGSFQAKTGIIATGTDYAGVYAVSYSGHAVFGTSRTVPAGGSVILAETTSGTTIGVDAAALRGQIDDTGTYGIGVYGLHAGKGIGVQGETAGAGVGVLGQSSGGTGVIGRSDSRTGVYGASQFANGTTFSVDAGVEGYSEAGAGVYGFAGEFRNTTGAGYGGRFEIFDNGLAQLLLTPFGSGGYPKTGTHQIGEIFMDPKGNLFVCVAAGAPGTWKQVAYSGTGPTDARLRHFTVARHGDRVDFHWHMADGKGVAGFELYAAGRRLNRETIRPHRAKTSDASATWKGEGPFALHVVMRDGNVITVWPE